MSPTDNIALRGALLVFALAAAHPAPAADAIVLQLNWKHQAEYAGYYVARENGYYADNHLTVDIRAAAPSDDVPALLTASDAAAAAAADVVVEFMAPALFAREQGAPLVNIAQPFKDTGLALVCRRDSGVRILDDLRGKKIGHAPGKGETVDILALLAKLNINAKSGIESATFNPKTDVRLIEFVDTEYGINSGIVDCIPWYLSKGLDALGFRRDEVEVFSFQNLGVGMLGGGLWVDEARLQDTVFADTMARFVRASMKGWRWAEKNPAETVAIVLDAMDDHTPQARDRQTRMLGEIIKLTGGLNGALKVEDYRRTVDILLDGGVLAEPPQNAWTSDITDLANLYADDRFDRLLADLGEWGQNFFLTLINPRSTLVHLGWALLVVSMLMRQALMVRVFVVSSTLTFAATDLFVRFDYASLSWSLLIVIAGLWTEVSDSIISKFTKFTLDEDNFRINQLPGLSRANCRKLFNKGRWAVAEEDCIVANEGHSVTHVYYICGGGIAYTRNGFPLLRRDAPLVTSLIPFLDTAPSFMTTTIEKGARYWEIESSALRGLLQDNQDIKNAINSMATTEFKKYGRVLAEQVVELQTRKPDNPAVASATGL